MTGENSDDAELEELVAKIEKMNSVPWKETAQGQREELQDLGYYGTLKGFIGWIEEMLMSGGLKLGEPEPHEFAQDRMVRELSLVTCGFSTDERLIYRIREEYLSIYWRSSHVGGLEIYKIPVEALESDVERQWLRDRRDGVFENVYRARKIRLYDAEGNYTEVYAPWGASLSFEENKDLRWTPEENGLLSIRPFLRDPWESSDGRS